VKSNPPKRKAPPKKSLSRKPSLRVSSNNQLVTAINILEDETFKFESKAAREAHEAAAEHGSHDMKEELALCLIDLTKDGDSDAIATDE